MKLTTYSPSDFVTVPWKNGKGETIELAINPGGTLAQFDWRLSIATVVEDGDFSDFSGVERNLILIEGNALHLHHQLAGIETKDNLDKKLSFATFDGASKTLGHLPAGPIKDFNLMHNPSKFDARVQTHLTTNSVVLSESEISFVYALGSSIDYVAKGKRETLEKGQLLKIQTLMDGDVTLSGSEMIVICLDEK